MVVQANPAHDFIWKSPTLILLVEIWYTIQDIVATPMISKIMAIIMAARAILAQNDDVPRQPIIYFLLFCEANSLCSKLLNLDILQKRLLRILCHSFLLKLICFLFVNYLVYLCCVYISVSLHTMLSQTIFLYANDFVPEHKSNHRNVVEQNVFPWNSSYTLPEQISVHKTTIMLTCCYRWRCFFIFPCSTMTTNQCAG